MNTTYWFSPLCAFVVTLTLVKVALRTRAVAAIQDIPSDRSLHSKPIPRVGGIALAFGATVGYLLSTQNPLRMVLYPALLLLVISAMDDIRGLSAKVRLVVHAFAAVTFVFFAFAARQDLVLAVFLTVGTIWMTNLYNFMDGSDGLAAGMTSIGFGAYGMKAFLSGSLELASLSVSLSSSALAFLIFNFHPARVFLGDAGSVPLGFLSAAVGLLGWNQGIWPVWFPVLVFSPFIFDATLTLIKRVLVGEPISKPHKKHYYQRLVQMGWGHRKTALIAYLLIMTVGVTSLWATTWPATAQMGFVVVWIVVYFHLAMRIDRAWQSFSHSSCKNRVNCCS